MRDPSMSWDVISLNPVSIQNIMFLFSERGISDGYRHMDGFSAHSYKWVNEKGEAFFVKYHIKTDGFLITKPIHTNINVKIGELKYEGYTENGIILNCINRVPTTI